MNCPECGKELELPDNVVANVESYGADSLSVTECCGKIVRVKRRIIVYAQRYEGSKTKDDWGRW